MKTEKKTPKPIKDDSAIRSEGAELYVQAYLQLELGLVTSKASRNMPGYDLTAHDLRTGRHCKIQVKYRKAINSDGMRIHNLGFDFVVYVAGNKGYVGEVPGEETATDPMKVFVIPRNVVETHPRPRGLYPNPAKGEHDQYRDAWRLIKEFLGSNAPRAVT